MKISLVDVWSGLNVGDAATLIAAVKFLKMFSDNILISCHTIYRTVDVMSQYKTLSQHARAHKLFPAIFPYMKLTPCQCPLSRRELLYYFIRSLIVLCFPKLSSVLLDEVERKALNDLLQSKLIVHKGGFFFGERKEMGLRNLFYDYMKLYLLLFARIHRRQMMILPVSSGPFYRRLGRWLIKYTLEGCLYIFVRGAKSREHLLSCGINPERIKLVPDIAFSLAKLDGNARAFPTFRVNVEKHPRVALSLHSSGKIRERKVFANDY